MAVAENFDEYVGKVFSDLPPWIKEVARPIYPNSLTTADLRPNRLNVRLDHHDRVVRIYWG